MTINEFFSKENILSGDPFSKVTFKHEITPDDYKRIGAIALKTAFDNKEYIPLQARLASEFAIVTVLLDLEPDEKTDSENLFKAFICYCFYAEFRKHYEEYAPFIQRVEMDIADLISYTQFRNNQPESVIDQIKNWIEDALTDETLISRINNITNKPS